MKFDSGAVGLVLASVLAGGLASAQSTQRMSVSSAGTPGNQASYIPAISADGRLVAFASDATNLVAGDTNGHKDIFVRDRFSGTTRRVSVNSAGAQANHLSEHPALSADGRFVAFSSPASNLVAGDTNGTHDIFVFDLLSSAVERVSVDSAGAQANQYCWFPALSADGRFVAFTSFATNLVSGDTNARDDIFVRDRLNGTTQRVSVDSGGAEGNGWCNYGYGPDRPSISADGRFVAFTSTSTNLVLGDFNGFGDVFVHDCLSGATERVSVDSAGLEANETSYFSLISGDGSCVAFMSVGSNLVPGDTNGLADIFVHDRQTGGTVRASVDTFGTEAGGQSEYPSISADGHLVAFRSYANNLVIGDMNGVRDIFVHDPFTGTTERVSLGNSGNEANAPVDWPAMSADGRFVAFSTTASNLVAGDNFSIEDVFVRNLGAPPAAAFCYGDGSAVACPCGNSGLGGHGCQNSASTGGAVLTTGGQAFLSADTLELTSSGELPSVLSIFLQGSSSITPVGFGDGLRCAGGLLKRLYIANATGGAISVPQAGSLSVSARSAALGDVLVAGATRWYQTYYRDPVLGFCPSPLGDSWNVSSGLVVVWSP